MASADYRKHSYEIWQAMAAGWDQQRQRMWEVSHPVSERMLEALQAQPGQTILELAAGTGETGFAAARAIGPEGRLISTDFAPEMVAAARRESERLGLENVEHREMDAEQMPLGDDSVDGVLCRWGFMLMADPARALAETRRVLRDGGRLALSVWGPPQRNGWASIPGRALAEHVGAPPPDPDSPGMFALADSERVRSLLRDAGLGEPRLEEVEVTWRFADFDDFWRFVTELAGGLAIVLRAMPEQDRGAVRESIERAVEGFRSGDGLEFPGVALNAYAG
ncbi:MAG TPA: methyltransferase domain-containing protein [Solirubrobacteraceae bacterium]|nr:methyltransferase domain-containing protein [Solirubrobacteraceae bacterium]